MPFVLATAYLIHPKSPDFRIYKNRIYKDRSPTKSLVETEKLSPSESSILLLSEICRDKCIPITVYIPNSSFWNSNYFQKEYKEILKNKSKKYGITFIYAEKEFIDKNDVNYFALEGLHLSVESYKKLSTIIFERISKNLKK